MMESTVTEILSGGVDVLQNGKNIFVPADTVILCVGDRQNDELYQACKESFKEVYNIGDSDQIGDIKSAVASGYELGIKI
jgi:hypothetical protein